METKIRRDLLAVALVYKAESLGKIMLAAVDSRLCSVPTPLVRAPVLSTEKPRAAIGRWSSNVSVVLLFPVNRFKVSNSTSG